MGDVRKGNWDELNRDMYSLEASEAEEHDELMDGVDRGGVSEFLELLDCAEDSSLGEEVELKCCSAPSWV
ncbi:hypothetical protein BpHYR1_008609 [Brachionus plicatilis]|uniref:Uncharacterized protein n=1 Tax=Brachionus plicatilis TaxID=10195 RepID=A0A3M7RA23_BRAPC|nr:hypothetical protein BpHYR1_008609 [Brachionus plicatilis]